MSTPSIQITSIRAKDGQQFTTVSDRSLVDAWRYLIHSEIGFGSRVIHISDNEVSTEVSFMGCHDVTRFKASAESLKFLRHTATVAKWLRDTQVEQPQDEKARLATALGLSTQHEVVSTGAGMLRGLNIERLTLVLLLADSAEDALRFKNLRAEDLIPLVELVYVDGVPLSDAEALLA